MRKHGESINRSFDLKKKTGVKAIILNLAIFLILLLLFEPTGKSDDYDMTNLLYGGMNGEYSPFILYINVVLGYFLNGLLMIFPSFPWYYIFSFGVILISFCVITYVLDSRGILDKYKACYFIVFLLSGYEFYIRITFTKTAGIVITAGMILLLYLIEKDKKLSFSYFGGAFLVIIGMLIRSSVFSMVLLLSFSCFIIFCIEHKENTKRLKRGILRFVVVATSLYIVSVGLGKINSNLYNDDEKWGGYISYNTTRAMLLDYSWPDYYKYEEEYTDLGISENDYIMWAQLANIADPEIFTEELMSDIRAIASTHSQKSNVDIFMEATKKLPAYLKNNTVFYIFLICGILLCFIGEKRGVRNFGIIFGFCIGIYYYLFYKGRIQHHVDASLFIMGTMLLLFYCKNSAFKLNHRIYTAIGILLINFIFLFYDEIASSSYYGIQYGTIPSEKTRYEENYAELSLLSKDKEHLYLFGANETNRIYPCFTVFQTIEKDFYSNIYRLNQYTVPVAREILEDYDIYDNNPLKKITDSDTIYYCVSKERDFEIDIVEKYIQEHYNDKARAMRVETLNHMYIYKFISSDLISDMETE